jgi:pimeloyl-ACP methyl ester carboxylesterase
MSVEWLRSCYSSEWFLFRDSPGTVTKGRYYFSPPDTPFFNGQTKLSSRNWHDSNWTTLQALGESVTAKQRWDNGAPPVVLPLAITIGESTCISQGERYADRAPDSAIIDGFSARCFLGDDEGLLLWQRASAITICSVQFFYGKIIEWLYGDNAGQIAEAFRLFLGARPVVTFHAGTSLLPACVTVIHDEFSLIVADGTRGFQQLALQAFFSITGPQNTGSYGTVALWYAASQSLHAYMLSDGADPTKPCLIVGHSYGGASAANLAARYHVGNPDRQVLLLTYGCPKPGDLRMQSILSEIESTALADDDDIVTVLPPDTLALVPVLSFLGIPGLRVFELWYPVPNQTRLDPDGSLTPNSRPVLDYATLLNATIRALAGIPLDPIAGHRITNYISRTVTRCPLPEWPIDIPTWVYLQGAAGAFVFDWPQLAGGDLVLDGAQIAGGDLVLDGPLVSMGDLVLDGAQIAAGDLVLDGSLVSMGDLVLDGAQIAAGDLVLDGSLVSMGDLVLDGSATAEGEIVFD